MFALLVFFSLSQGARRVKDEPAFFYPHNMDFRGRAYPMHPHLHHLGSDNCRGLLQFASGQLLGPNGLKWLKVRLALRVCKSVASGSWVWGAFLRT